LDVPDLLLTLTTDRLRLRELNMSDAPDVFAYASDPEVTRYTSWATHQTLADSERFLESVVLKYYTEKPMDWGIEHKDSGKLIGTCGLINWEPNHARAEIGYVLARPYWGQGYATEAVRAVISFGFHVMLLNRIQATCMLDNTASARVMEKVGMQYEGILREYALIREQYRDLKLYAIIKPKNDFHFEARSLLNFPIDMP
jgi:ribosomal-protein-alanine N-acetyltransferase